MKRYFPVLFLLLMLAMAKQSSAQEQESKVDSLAREVEILKARVKKLEKYQGPGYSKEYSVVFPGGKIFWMSSAPIGHSESRSPGCKKYR